MLTTALIFLVIASYAAAFAPRLGSGLKAHKSGLSMKNVRARHSESVFGLK